MAGPGKRKIATAPSAVSDCAITIGAGASLWWAWSSAAGATVDTDPLQGQAADDLIGRCPGI